MTQTSKCNPLPIISRHQQTFVGTDGKFQIRDILQQYGVPAVAGVVMFILDANISSTSAAALMTLTGIFAAFCFQLSVQILTRAAMWAEGDTSAGPATSKLATLLEELSANALYTALVAASASIMIFASGNISYGWLERVITAVATILIAHLAMTLLMVITRVFLLTQARLIEVRTRHTS